jgi:hypothetical protein
MIQAFRVTPSGVMKAFRVTPSGVMRAASYVTPESVTLNDSEHWRKSMSYLDEDDKTDRNRFRNVGGTRGGIGEFLIGFVMAVAGGYLLMNQVTVTSGFWYFWGYNAFGLSLLPLIFGIGILFFNGKSIIGWLLLIAGAAIIFVGIIVNLQIYFRPTSLFNTIIMLILLVGGIGLVARSLRAH